MDDILFYFDNEELYEEHLKKVLKILRMKQVSFPGHIISKYSIVIDPSKVAEIME